MPILYLIIVSLITWLTKITFYFRNWIQLNGYMLYTLYVVCLVRTYQHNLCLQFQLDIKFSKSSSICHDIIGRMLPDPLLGWTSWIKKGWLNSLSPVLWYWLCLPWRGMADNPGMATGYQQVEHSQIHEACITPTSHWYRKQIAKLLYYLPCW